ncbi:MAG: 30S ribosomal protein S30 [Flavobacteriaceae bacterium]|nr:30S ribosomal protein S30 [Flavobacteriaceae bacterium]
MQIHIQYLKLDVSETLDQFTTKKLRKLAEKYDWLIRAEVWFKKGQDKGGTDSICEIELSAPGPRLFASSTEAHFEAAVKESVADLERQLKKRKAQLTAH